MMTSATVPTFVCMMILKFGMMMGNAASDYLELFISVEVGEMNSAYMIV